MKSFEIIVFGAGSFGTCLAQHLSQKGKSVALWSRRKELAERINQDHENSEYLANISLSPDLKAIASIEPDLITKAKALVLAVPTQKLRQFLPLIKPFISEEQLLVSTAKGIEMDSGLFPSDVISDILGRRIAEQMVTLSGPSFAGEVARGQPTGVSAASLQLPRAIWAQNLFHSPSFRVYTHQDPRGLEVAGALKNVVAIAAGACRGLGFEANAHAVLLTRGLAEMQRVGKALGADPLTFNGLGGVGDLILTCSSEKSRNFRLGLRLAKDGAYVAGSEPIEFLAEGFGTAKAAVNLAEGLGVEVPISRAVYEVLYEGKQVRQAVFELMNRKSSQEL